jgi:hypothetical protein
MTPILVNVIACSGQAVMQWPQAWQSLDRTAKACRLPWMRDLKREKSGIAALSASLRICISKTSHGHAATQSSLPSQRLRSITGT